MSSPLSVRFGVGFCRVSRVFFGGDLETLPPSDH